MHKQSSDRCGLVGLMTGGASMVQLWKLSPGGRNLVPV
jgi:hypothetical protein